MSGTASLEPRLKLRIQKNLFVPFEVLVAAEQGRSVHHYLKNPFLVPHNDPKLKIYYPRLNFETWSEGLNIFMIAWVELHPEDALPLMHYMQMIRNMAKVFPASIWLGYDREFRILKQKHPSLPWNVPLPQLYFQQLMKTSPFGVKGGDSPFHYRDRNWGEGTGIEVVQQISIEDPLIRNRHRNKLLISISDRVIALILICMGHVRGLKNVHLLPTGAPSVMTNMGRLNVNVLPPQFPQDQQKLPPPPPGSNFKPVTPIHPEHLLHILEGSPFPEVYQGFKFGFRIPHCPSPWSHPVWNHKSARSNESFLDQ